MVGATRDSVVSHSQGIFATHNIKCILLRQVYKSEKHYNNYPVQCPDYRALTYDTGFLPKIIKLKVIY